jgi:wyosine [tRNA(Phe)-imidazoG37] synthetase (radical SAM superfamily)
MPALRTNRTYLYGPVPSRRLGFSLGVDLLPFKTCSMDCVYCQLGAEAATTVRRRSFVPIDDVLKQIEEVLRSGRQVEAITFSGSGEPTLHAGIGRLIRDIKRRTSVPVIVLTNSSMISRPAVRRDLAAADIVVPSLDAVTESVFKKVNRPHPSLSAAEIVDGLAVFRRGYPGQIWLEILLVRGINDSLPHLRALKSAIARIRPDRVQLNTVVRPPAEKTAQPLGLEDLERVKAFLGGTAEIIADFKKSDQAPAGKNVADLVREFIRRRPETADGIARSLGTTAVEVRRACRELEEQGGIRSVIHDGRTYYEPASPDSKPEA